MQPQPQLIELPPDALDHAPQRRRRGVFLVLILMFVATLATVAITTRYQMGGAERIGGMWVVYRLDRWTGQVEAVPVLP